MQTERDAKKDKKRYRAKGIKKKKPIEGDRRMIKPKYVPSKAVQTATRQFTDRDEFTTLFLKALEKGPQDFKVLVFYGVGGIGKSSLRKELQRLIKERSKGKLMALIDFDMDAHRQPNTALFVLRESLNDSVRVRIPFPTFDLAFALYIKKRSPHVVLKPDDMPLLEEGGLVADLLSTLGDIPLVGLAPNIMKILHKGHRKYEQWVVNGQDTLKQMQELEAPELLNYLPYYWAEDLKRYLEKGVGGTPVIFLDTYEALWEGNKQAADLSRADEWIRELIANLPQVLWVLTGRERVQWATVDQEWETALDQHLVGGLDVKDADGFLQSCGIEGDSIRSAIIEGSAGLPLYLDLSVDTYLLLQGLRPPVADDFARTPKGVFERFLRYLDDRELATLRLLSLPRFWDENLLIELVSHFKTGYPITEYHRLLRFSFITAQEGGESWVLHELMRGSLAEDTKTKLPKVFMEGNMVVHVFYDERLVGIDARAIGRREQIALGEAFFHLNQITDSHTILSWLDTRTQFFQSAGHWDWLIPLYESLQQRDGLLKATEQANIAYNLGEFYRMLGREVLATSKFQQAIAVLNKVDDKDQHPEVYALMAECYRGYAQMPSNTNENAMLLFAAGKECYERVVDSLGLPVKYRFAELLIRLGKKQVFLSRYGEAEQSYSRAMELCRQVLADAPEHTSAHRTLGLVEEKMGELQMVFGNSREAGSLYRRAVESFERALLRVGEVDYVLTLHDKAFAIKRLAEYYTAEGGQELAASSFKQAIDLYNDVLKLSSNYVDAHINKGHAMVDLIRLLVTNGQYQEAKQWFALAKVTFGWLIIHVPHLAAAHNRFGSLYRIIGTIYAREGDRAGAMQAFERALSFHDQAERVSGGEYLYAYKSKGETLCQIAILHLEEGQRKEADRVISEAIALFDKILQRAPGAEYAERARKEALDLLTT